jgi:hypothetical protein
VNTITQSSSVRQRATKELAYLSGFLFLGLVVMPFIVFQVGQAVFGAYGGAGYGDFFGTLSAKVRSGNSVAWFLILSPYLGWQCLRLLVFGWRMAGLQNGSS